MMRKIYFLLLIVFLVACNSDKIMLFDVDAENSAALRFVNADMGTDLSGNALLGENDTTQTVTFVVRKETYLIDTINLIVTTSGPVLNKERVFAIEQVVEYPKFTYLYDEHNNVVDSVIDAVAGVHYRPLDDPYTASFLRIPAGETQRVVPILLLRSKDLQERPYRLKLRLVPNENFAVDFDAPSKVRIINFSDIPSMPLYWEKDAVWFFGRYSATKLRFMVNYSDIDLSGSNLLNYGAADFTYYQKRLQKALMEYNATQLTPLKDETGRTMVFQYELN